MESDCTSCKLFLIATVRDYVREIGYPKKAKVDTKDKKKGEIYKENKKLRKQTKKNYELATNIKLIWEEMRK
jgi:hypothetical protein